MIAVNANLDNAKDFARIDIARRLAIQAANHAQEAERALSLALDEVLNKGEHADLMKEQAKNYARKAWVSAKLAKVAAERAFGIIEP